MHSAAASHTSRTRDASFHYEIYFRWSVGADTALVCRKQSNDIQDKLFIGAQATYVQSQHSHFIPETSAIAAFFFTSVAALSIRSFTSSVSSTLILPGCNLNGSVSKCTSEISDNAFSRTCVSSNAISLRPIVGYHRVLLQPSHQMHTGAQIYYYLCLKMPFQKARL